MPVVRLRLPALSTAPSPTVAAVVTKASVTPTPAHSEAQVADLVEALVDVWKTLGLKFEEARVIPLIRANAIEDAHCVYPEMKRAAE